MASVTIQPDIPTKSKNDVDYDSFEENNKPPATESDIAKYSINDLEKYYCGSCKSL